VLFDDIFGSPFGNRCNAGGAAWVRPSDWLPMPNTPTNTVNMLARIEDSLDSTFASVTVSGTGSFYVDWGDGLGEQTYASGVNAVKAYVYATALTNPQDATLGFKQAMVKVRGTEITSFRLSIIPSAISSWVMFVQPYLDVHVNLPSCTNLQSYTANCQCRKIERWVILACGNIVDMSNMFFGNTSCQSYTFPAGFGAVCINMSLMFYSNYSCQSYMFPEGFGAVATNMSGMFNNNNSCQSYTLPTGFGAVATNMSSMFYSNNSCQSYTFPAGFGTVCTNMSIMFAYNTSCQSYMFPAGFGAAVTTVGDIGPISQRITTKIRGLAYAQTFSIANSNLQHNELVEVFNALPTVTAKTLTITGNPGVPALIPADDAIATAKGWTLVK